ncbi:cache domain-containing sensor histidine kinase [Blautia sp. HCP3S3_H10_1]|uniref:cache domain-containing sensor histidine kinase n=1 Tax=unclassified Blautia TaxID=2648079 RepID=UPI003F920CC7|nr:histidine kinase [Clostridia bacterium]
MRKWIGKFKTISIQKKMAIAMLVTPVLSSLVILGFYYNYTREFYREKVAIFQENNRKNMTANVNNILRQIDTISDQVLGLAVLSSEFEGYSEKSTYDRLLLYRKITSQLTNICISNDTVDNIYILDFDGNGFSSNSEWNEELYKTQLEEPLSKMQQGKKVVLPPHRATYRYRGNADKAPYMVSLLIYLNQYTQSGAIGLIQMDIPYEKIRKSVELLEMTESDFSFIVDEDNYLIYAPDSSDIGKEAGNITYGKYNLGELVTKCGQDEENAEKSLIKRVELSNKEWYLIQVNSDAMFREELGKIQNTWLLVFTICLLCALGLSLSLSHSITKPIAVLIKGMGKVSQGNFDIQVDKPDNKDLAELVEGFNTMIREVDVLMKENIQKEHEKTRMEMMALNAKINSHFLYNTLNTIKWQAISQNQMDIANSIVALTKILEYSCKNTVDMVALKEEIRFIEDYIYIQNMRYGSNVAVKYQVEKGCEECLVLKMLLQPIVENALIHAFDNNGKENIITVTCAKKSGQLKICVYDNGCGFQYEGFDKLTGIGLNNIKDRLEINFGKESEMRIHSIIGEGTCVTVVFPIVEGGKTANESLTDR